MRTSNALNRLSAAAPALLSRPESVVGPVEEDRILAGIFAAGPGAERPTAHRAGPVLLFAGAAVAVAAIGIVASGVVSRSTPPATRVGGGRHVVLSGPRIQLAGYRFRTPAGFKRSSGSCMPAATAGKPTTVLNGFAAAASADGGCVEAAYLIAPSGLQGGPIPGDAQPVAVGPYEGYFVSQSVDGGSALYVGLPKAGGDQSIVYLVLLARDLTEGQLIAVAESGLPG